MEQAKADHKDFREAFVLGKCSICDADLSSFNKGQPCLHWLLRPPGFTKRHFMEVANRFGFFQIQAYLRWVANEEAKAQNINDLRVEGTGKKIEVTIRYKTYEWSFSCGESDYAGHMTASPEAQQPHYHFQMRVNRAAFIRYNDFHVPFSDMDIVQMEAASAAPDVVKGAFLGGESMSDVLNNETLEAVVRHGILPSDSNNAPIKLDSIVMAEEGSAISGDSIEAIFAEARGKGVTVASLLHKLPNVKVTTIVTPGPGVVEQAPRLGRGRN